MKTLIPKDDSRYQTLDFDGSTYNPALDRHRLNPQMQRVFDLMRDGKWRTLREIAEATGDPETSVSSRLRDLRKPRFGGYLVQRKRISTNGLHQYRVVA